MRKLKKITMTAFSVCAVVFFSHIASTAGPVDTVPEKSRCPVCGMFVAKYPDWIAQIVSGNDTFYFDGTKDMFAYFFNPRQFNGPAQEDLKEIWVKDYYSLEWIDGRIAYYVVGSDVYGPMGHELIPFSSSEASEAFKADHKGKKIYRFEEITPEIIESMRQGQRMR